MLNPYQEDETKIRTKEVLIDGNRITKQKLIGGEVIESSREEIILDENQNMRFVDSRIDCSYTIKYPSLANKKIMGAQLIDRKNGNTVEECRFRERGPEERKYRAKDLPYKCQFPMTGPKYAFLEQVGLPRKMIVENPKGWYLSVLCQTLRPGHRNVCLVDIMAIKHLLGLEHKQMKGIRVKANIPNALAGNPQGDFLVKLIVQ